jgi:hypothetical protein
MERYGEEERLVASAVASLGQQFKRKSYDPTADAAGGPKRGKTQHDMDEDQAIVPAVPLMGPLLPPAALDNNSETADEQVLRPYPFFYYREYSKEVDPDPLTPLTPPGRVPNFPAKMHAILSRPDLADIVCWAPHGRSWRVLKPREFEIKVIPIYFEHAKFSSFIRQANGWGFRRITQGRDRNSYYHERFLRGLPHLCKLMKRPGVAEKQAADPDQEPDLYKISEAFPVPQQAEDDSILLQCTLQGGPKARMPIYSGALRSVAPKLEISILDAKPTATVPKLTPRDQDTLSAFAQALGASESQFRDLRLGLAQRSAAAAAPPQRPIALPLPAFATTAAPAPLPFQVGNGSHKLSVLAAANRLAFAGNNNSNSHGSRYESDMAAAQFAAGFAAATALSQQQLRSVLGSLSFTPQNPPQQTPRQPSDVLFRSAFAPQR